MHKISILPPLTAIFLKLYFANYQTDPYFRLVSLHALCAPCSCLNASCMVMPCMASHVPARSWTGHQVDIVYALVMESAMTKCVHVVSKILILQRSCTLCNCK